MSFIKAIPPKLLRDQFGMYKGGSRTGWHGEMDRCWIDNDKDICVTSRLIRTKFGTVEHVCISKGLMTNDGTGDIPWAQKMAIKNELFGENRFAIEVYPKQKNLVDDSDVYHLWVFDKKMEMPFGISKKEYQKAVNRGYNISQEDLSVLKQDYIRAGKI